MSLLFAAPGWDEGPWLERFAALLPGRAIVTPETLVDRAAVRYAIVWRHRPALLAELPQARSDLLARRRRRSHPLRPAPARRPDRARRRSRPDGADERMGRAALPDASAPDRAATSASSASGSGPTTTISPRRATCASAFSASANSAATRRRKLAALGFPSRGLERQRQDRAGDRLFRRRRRARRDAGAHRHPRLPAAADRRDARHPQRGAVRQAAARRKARRPDPDQRRPRRAAGRSRHCRRARFRRR